ncbi:hypothetical protein [Altericista sp. CCNU0014]|uniref:hypothetical protein n=1 Tax=Altericista sp. CCNU0014 TaxID=3082949 RepID=UPI00384C09EC
MTVAQAQELPKNQAVKMVRSFLIWTFTLTVCWLVVGFPLVFLILTVGSLFAISLQAILPTSAVLVVAGAILSVNVLVILFGAALLTLKGIHPHEVQWLRWLNGQANPSHGAVFASCPLTCDRPPV